MKFPQMPYTRPDVEEIKAKLTDLTARLKSSSSAEETFDIYKEYDDFNKHTMSMFNIASIRYTLDTTDKFYNEEQNFSIEAGPKLRAFEQSFFDALLESPFRADMEAEWGPILFTNREMASKTFSPEIVADLQEEGRLVKQYNELIASAQIEFDGKTLTLAQISPYYQNTCQDTRKAAIKASSAWYMERADKLDGIFDELVKVRTRIANKLGHDTFTQVGYYRMQRNSYDRNDVAKFRDGVVKYIVPIAARLKAEQAKRIGVDGTKLKIHDDSFQYPEGNAKPIGTPDDIFAHGKTMYHELSGETAEFIDFMMENDLFDVLTRPGKRSGGYCSSIPIYRAPFIFANFNGTSGDIDVLTHEAGHAFAGYVARDMYPSLLRRYSMETAEVHSMAMEFFTWPWMEGFFGDQTQKYYYSHLASALIFIPYGTMVDEFQHHIYDKPNMTPKERNNLWLELEAKYRPWLDLSDTPFYGEGRRWQGQSHIFGMPFYYIDYCIAQIMALSFWAQDQKDHDAAWAKYRRFLGFAGSKTFVQLIEDAGLPTPFEPNNLKDVADATVEWLNKA